MNTKLFIRILRNLLIGFAITIVTPLFSTFTVTKLEQLSDLRYGLPFRFISQQSWLTPFEENLPLKLHIGLPQENPTRIIIGDFLLSLISITIVLFFINTLWTILRKNSEAYVTDSSDIRFVSV